MMTFLSQQNKGYTLLFAVLVSSLVLAIGISILNISKKEFLIATATRDSSSALYSADSGIECAIYSETGLLQSGSARDTFNTATDNTVNFGCALLPHSAITRTITDSLSPPSGTFVFHVKFGSNNESCAVVTVTKAWVGTPAKYKTTYESRGYNIGWRQTGSDPNIGLCDKISAKRVERALKYSTL